MGRPKPAPSLQDSAVLFAALGDPQRLRLVVRLGEHGPLSIAKLVDGSHVTRQAIRKHLQVLSSAGLVTNLKQGRENLWELSPAGLLPAKRALDVIEARWNTSLQRLKALVEDET